MSHSYYELHYHLVWATRLREPAILPEVQDRLYGCIREKCEALGCRVHEIGGVRDHIHLALAVPAPVAVARVAHDAKGSSSHLMNSEAIGKGLYWQQGYGAVSIRRKDVPIVREYIRQQERRHAEDRLWPELERTSSDACAQASKPSAG